MKKLILVCIVFLANTIFTQAQNTIIQRIDLRSDCNRSWEYNDSRFYKLIWDGMVKGKIQVYINNEESIQPTSISDIYFLVSNARNLEYELMGIYDQPIKLSTREDSLSLLTPVYYEIFGSYEAKEPLNVKKQWVRVVSVSEPDYGFYLSYPELIKYLDQSNSYWVNPYNSVDSVSFSKALQEERYVFEWIGESSDVKFYDSGRYTEKVFTTTYEFKGNLTRYAYAEDIANRPYFVQRPAGTVISVLMNAYLNGRINGYQWVAPGKVEMFTKSTFDNKVLNDLLGNADWMYEGEDAPVNVTYELFSSYLDLFGVNSDITIVDTPTSSSNSENQPSYFIIGTSIWNYNNYRETDYPFILFNYSEAMQVLEKSGLMWYATDNHADSCSIASAIKANKVFWNGAALTDRNVEYGYSCQYNADSAKVIINNPHDICTQGLINRTQKVVIEKMNATYADKNYPSNASIPVYLHYRAVRMLDKIEDSTLTYLNDLSVYIVDKALKGQLTLYANDSLNTKLSNAEFSERMLIQGILIDEDGNEQLIVDSLESSSFHICYVNTDFFINSKGKLSMKDRSLKLVIPVEYSPKGIEYPLVSLSYPELELLMKKDKKGKTLLKQISLTSKSPYYTQINDPYGNELYLVWNENKEEQAKALPAALQPYLKKTVKY